MNTFHWFRDQVVVLGRLQRHIDAGHSTDGTSPHSGAVGHYPGLDVARGRSHSGDSTVRRANPCDRDILEDAHAAVAGAFGEGLGNISGIQARVVWEVERGHDVAYVGERPHLLYFGGADLVGLDAEALRKVEAAAHLPGLIGCVRDLDRSGVDDTGGLAGFRFERAVEVQRVLRQLCMRFALSQRCDQARGMPCRAGRELFPLKQYHVGPAELREMVGHRAARHATADDDDACVGRQP